MYRSRQSAIQNTDYENDNIKTLRIMHDIVQELQHIKYAAEILVQVRIFLERAQNRHATSV
jgi:hypothetical protein